MRSNQAAALTLALALVSCRTNVAKAQMLIVPVEPVELVVCIFQASADQDTGKLSDKFQSQASGGSYFTSLVRVDSIDDAQNCDVSVKLVYEKTDTKPVTKTGRAEVFAARSKRMLFHVEKRQGWGWGFAGDLATEVRDRFKNDSSLVRSLTAEKAPAKTETEEARAAPPAEVPAAPKAAPESDVDHPAAKLAEHPDDFAVVVGIEKYSNDLPDAQFAERDATAVKNHLLALGYPERNIKYLTGSRATGTSLASYIEEWLPRNVKGNSRVFFYFSGHGAPSESGQAFLVPWDGNPNFLDKSAYPLKKLYAQLGSLKVKQVIVALDSCFSGAGGRSVLAEGARPLVTKVDTSVAPGSKLALFAAASSKEMTSTLKDQGHGIFTYYFLKGLGGAAKDDAGAVTARGLYEYLKPKVQDAAARQNRDQTPALEGMTDGEIAHF